MVHKFVTLCVSHNEVHLLAGELGHLVLPRHQHALMDLLLQTLPKYM